MVPLIGKALPFAVGLALSLLATTAFAQITVTNHSANFRTGPYSAIAVHPAHPERVVVATENGYITWTNDDGRDSKDALVLAPRRYDAFAVRAGSRVTLSMRRPSSARAHRLFMMQLREGMPTTRHAHWMVISDPITTVSEIAMPAGEGPMLIAAPSGIWLSDDHNAAWTRTVGGPGPMPRKNDLIGLAAIIDPTDPLHMLAATDRGVMVSTNGGNTFAPHPDPDIADEYVTRFVWDHEQTDVVFAVAQQLIYLSDDGGKTFSPAFTVDGEIRDISVSDAGVFVATDKGLFIAGADDTIHLLEGKDLIGAIPWQGGGIVAATKETLYYIRNTKAYPVLQTTPTDPYLKLRGGGTHGWLLSKFAVLRIGPKLPSSKPPGYKPPRLLMSMIEVERAVNKYLELPAPKDTRLHDRWYAKLLPTLIVQARGSLYRSSQTTIDATFPVRFRYSTAYEDSKISWVVWARWDLSTFLLGDNNASNPHAFIEASLRQGTKELRERIRWHYREAAQLVEQLKAVPDDPIMAMNMRWRLEEYTSYLSFMSGKQVLENNTEE